MPKEIKIRVREVVGDEMCVSSNDGNKLYNRISPLLKEGHRVTLSFLNTKTKATAFFNAGFSPLYGEYSQDLLNSMLIIEDLDKRDEIRLKRVIDNALSYYSNPEEYVQKMKEALEK